VGGGLSPDSCSLCPLHLPCITHQLLALTDASLNALTDPYVLLVVLLSLVVNTIPSLTVRLYCTIMGKTTIQQVRAGWGGWPGEGSSSCHHQCLGLARVLPLIGRVRVPGEATASAVAVGHHLSLVAQLSWWWSLMTLVFKSGSRALSPNWFMAQQEAMGQETCSSSRRGSALGCSKELPSRTP